MGDIQVGDKVLNPDGSTANVVLTHHVRKSVVYRVEFVDGAETSAASDHLWEVRISGRHDPKETQVMTTEGILRFLDMQPKHRDRHFNGADAVMVPHTTPVQFAPRSLPPAVHPYVLGVLLGDGCLREYDSQKGTIRFSTNDRFIVREMEWLTGLSFREEKSGGGFWHHGFSDLYHQLKQLGVYGKTAIDKCVPDVYLVNGESVRWAVLQGLMDTDGYVDASGNCSFTSISVGLAKDVQWLCRSLGFRATISKSRAGYRSKSTGEYIRCNDAYDVYIQGPNKERLFRLPRKWRRCVDNPRPWGTSYGRKITAIERDYSGEAKCITIDHPNGLYLTDDFVVTHNSVAAIGFFLKGNPHRLAEHHRNGTTPHPADYSYLNHPKYYALGLRRNFEDLFAWIENEAKWRFQALGARYRERPREFYWDLDGAGNGPHIFLGHLADTSSYSHYAGGQVHRLWIDEAGFMPDWQTYEHMRSIPRSAYAELIPQILLTTNPIGPSAPGLFRRFINIKGKDGRLVPPGTTITETRYNEYLKRDYSESRVYLTGKLLDNAALLEKDPGYLTRLDLLEEPLRSVYRHGSWTSLQGTYFGHVFRPDGPLPIENGMEPPNARHVYPHNQVMSAIRPWFPMILGLDWGYDHYTAILKARLDDKERLLIYGEKYDRKIDAEAWGVRIGTWCLEDFQASDGKLKNAVLFMSPEELGSKGEKYSKAELMRKGIAQVIGHDAAVVMPDEEWETLSVESRMELQREVSIVIRPAQNERVAGWEFLRSLMRWWSDVPQAPAIDWDESVRILHNEGSDKFRDYVIARQSKLQTLPRIIISDQCTATRNALETRQHVGMMNESGIVMKANTRQTNPEDVLKTNDLGDQIADALRYLAMGYRRVTEREPMKDSIARRIEEMRAAGKLTSSNMEFAAEFQRRLYESQNPGVEPLRITRRGVYTLSQWRKRQSAMHGRHR